MAQTQFLSPEVAVGPQIVPDDLKGLAADGFKAIICNRPDNEAPGQPSYAALEAAAKAAGMKAVYLPIQPNGMTMAHAESFKQHLEALPKPVLAFCRTGARSSMLFTACARMPGR